MLKNLRSVNRIFGCFIRNFSTTNKHNFKVTVIGACGGIGQPLCLLLKREPLVSKLVIYDNVRIPGVYADLSHIDTKTIVEGYQCVENLPAALKDADIVVITGGFPRKPGMTRDDLFAKNVGLVTSIGPFIAKNCAKALIAIVTNPANSCVPAMAEILKQNNAYDPKRLFGVTSLDLVRSRTFIGEILGIDPATVSMPIIGGHSGETIIPLLSQCKPPLKLEKEAAQKLIKRIQDAGTEVVKAKSLDGGSSATLSMAHATEIFTTALLQALKGDCQPVKCAYVASDVTECAFFSTPVQLGPNGVENNLGLPGMDGSEQVMLCKAKEILKRNIQRGVDYANKMAKDVKKCNGNAKM